MSTENFYKAAMAFLYFPTCYGSEHSKYTKENKFKLTSNTLAVC